MVSALGGCSDATTPTGPPPGPVPTALEIRGLPEEPMEIGTVTQLTAWATFSDGVTGQVDPLWSSSAPEVASVDGRGFVFAHGAGETRITATLGPASAEAGVAVAPDERVSASGVTDPPPLTAARWSRPENEVRTPWSPQR